MAAILKRIAGTICDDGSLISAWKINRFAKVESPSNLTSKEIYTMKLVRYGRPQEEKPGILDADGRVRDLTSAIPDVTGKTISPTSLGSLRNIDVTKLPLASETAEAVRFGPCVGGIGH